MLLLLRGVNGLLAVQALYTMTLQIESAGDPKENQLAGASYDRVDLVWPIIAKRVRIIPEYDEMFIEFLHALACTQSMKGRLGRPECATRGSGVG